MARIERGPSVVLADVVGVGGKSGNTGSVTVGVVQGVVAKQLKLRPQADVAVHDELLLAEIAFGRVLVDAISAQGLWAQAQCQQLIEATGTQIGDRKRRRLGELSLDADCRLQRVWSVQPRVDLVYGRGCSSRRRAASRKGKGLADPRKTCGIADDIFLLRDAV